MIYESFTFTFIVLSWGYSSNFKDLMLDSQPLLSKDQLHIISPILNEFITSPLTVYFCCTDEILSYFSWMWEEQDWSEEPSDESFVVKDAVRINQGGLCDM